MALRIQDTDNTKASLRLQTDNSSNCQVIRDNKVVGDLPSRGTRPVFDSKKFESASSQDWSYEIEQKIADSFEKKDIVGLVNMLCKSNESPIYIRKKINSPLYVHFGGSKEELDESVREKIGLAETAVFILLNDDEISLKEIADAFQVFTQKNSIYKPPLKLSNEFHKRLGLFENIRKTDEIIQKLREAGQSLGFNR